MTQHIHIAGICLENNNTRLSNPVHATIGLCRPSDLQMSTLTSGVAVAVRASTGICDHKAKIVLR